MSLDRRQQPPKLGNLKEKRVVEQAKSIPNYMKKQESENKPMYLRPKEKLANNSDLTFKIDKRDKRTDFY